MGRFEFVTQLTAPCADPLARLQQQRSIEFNSQSITALLSWRLRMRKSEFGTRIIGVRSIRILLPPPQSPHLRSILKAQG